MLKRLLLACSVLLLTACASTEKITDFTDRSVVYGWVDVRDVDANRLFAVDIYQFRPHAEKPYHSVWVKKFKKGFLYYSWTVPAGAHKIVSVRGQSCFILCGNTIYEYSLGKQGDEVGALIIKTPGIYTAGSYKFKTVKTGFFEADKFEVVAAENGPSKREMLEEILKDKKVDPVIVDRITRELAQP